MVKFLRRCDGYGRELGHPPPGENRPGQRAVVRKLERWNGKAKNPFPALMIHTNIPLEMKKCNYFDFTIVDDVFQYFFLTILCWFMIFKGILMFFFKVLSLFSWFFTVLSLSLSTMYRSSLKLSHSVKYAKNALLEALFIHHCAQKQIPGSVLSFVCALLLKNLEPNCNPT